MIEIYNNGGDKFDVRFYVGPEVRIISVSPSVKHTVTMSSLWWALQISNQIFSCCWSPSCWLRYIQGSLKKSKKSNENEWVRSLYVTFCYYKGDSWVKSWLNLNTFSWVCLTRHHICVIMPSSLRCCDWQLLWVSSNRQPNSCFTLEEVIKCARNFKWRRERRETERRRNCLKMKVLTIISTIVYSEQ